MPRPAITITTMPLIHACTDWFDKKNSVLVFITELFMDGSLRS